MGIESIKQSLITGTFYTALAKYSAIFVSLFISAVLARLLTPQDFASIAIATLIIWFFNVFSEAGIGAAIIQSQELSKNVLADIYSYTLYMGIIFTVISFFFAGLIGKYYENESLIILCRILSANIFFATINIVPNALMYKNKLFKFIAVRTFILNIAGGVIGVIAAILGFGVYSLLISPMLTCMGTFIINFVKFPQQFNLLPHLRSLKYILTFSVYQFLYYIIYYFSLSIDKFVIGKFISMKVLGYYDKPYRLISMPVDNITHVITPVMLPVFSDFQGNKDVVINYYLKIIHFLAYIGFPLSVFLFFSAKELILLFFGNQWNPSIEIFKVLAFSVGIRIILSSIISVYQSMGAVKLLMFMGILVFFIQLIGILIWYLFYTTVIVFSWIIVTTFIINFILSYILLFRYVFNVSIMKFFRQLYSPFFLAILLFITLFLIGNIVCKNLIISLLIKIITSILLFISYVQIIGKYNIIDKIKHCILI